ncbi:MFS transporter [Pseudomonas indica]|uniref:Fucose permease n=1 Tax=Pseudomonas indica TaxID=137658 RepID=A0A1G9Q3N5_9PSED|nr:MFS transporter [Pseudomonas indica]MBU3059063.1 MFS transporter [Pseudomonas indica]PAU59966.1 hypothetical protein BZL42_10945 [Pseudomonas indica]SDM05616.1 Fucose permease [Pseudomonas indica]
MTSISPAHMARWACAYCFAVNGLLHGSAMARIPALKAQAALDERALGQALLGLGFGALLAFPLTGVLVRRLGARMILSVSCLVLLLLFPLLGLVGNAWHLAAMLFLIGMASGALDVAVNTQAVEVERLLGRPCLSGMHGMYSLGGLVGALGAAALASWPPFWHFSLIAVPGLLALPWSRKRFLPDPPPKPVESKAPLLVLPPLPVLGLGLLALCSFVSEGAIADWSALLLHDVFASSERVAALGFAAFSATMVFGRLFGDRLRVLFADVSLLRGLSILATAGMLLALFGPSAPWAIIGFALAGLGLSVIVPIVFSAAGNRPGVDTSVGVAAVATLGYGGLLLGPPLIGLLAHYIGLRLALLSVVGLCVFLILGSPWVKRPDAGRQA